MDIKRAWKNFLTEVNKELERHIKGEKNMATMEDIWKEEEKEGK